MFPLFPPHFPQSLPRRGWVEFRQNCNIEISGGKCKCAKKIFLDFNIFYKIACLMQAILHVKCVICNDSWNSLESFVATGSRSLLLTLVVIAL